MVSIETSPETEAMARARAALLALNRRTDTVGAQAAEALFELNLVHPPYPPAHVVSEDQMPDVEDVRELLLAAAAAASDVAEIARITQAAAAFDTPYIR
ncbi:hypothetical protein [Georgenia soli]|nr:hypothetical protein [Georgenia soli]